MHHIVVDLQSNMSGAIYGYQKSYTIINWEGFYPAEILKRGQYKEGNPCSTLKCTCTYDDHNVFHSNHACRNMKSSFWVYTSLYSHYIYYHRRGLFLK